MLTKRESPRRWKRTSPSIFANRVSSEPRPTLTPGLKRVPRWRTRIEPPVTNWPAKRFTPSIWGFESRPFLELPTPFLCAMSLDLDLRDADGRQDLPMPALPPVVLSPLELDHEHLGVLLLDDHLAGDPGRLERPGLHGDLAVLVDEQDLLELHRRAPGLAEPLHLDDLARCHPVLLPARRDDRFHLSPLIFSLERALLRVAVWPLRPQGAHRGVPATVGRFAPLALLPCRLNVTCYALRLGLFAHLALLPCRLNVTCYALRLGLFAPLALLPCRLNVTCYALRLGLFAPLALLPCRLNVTCYALRL